jgi:hypothetical protein
VDDGNLESDEGNNRGDISNVTIPFPHNKRTSVTIKGRKDSNTHTPNSKPDFTNEM